MGLDSGRPETASLADTAAIFSAVLVFGITFGAIGVKYGLQHSSAIVMSLLASSGASQIATLSIAAEGGSLTAALLSGWLIASRFTLLGVGISKRLGIYGAANLLAAQLLIDASAAAAARPATARAARADYYRIGIAVYVAWITGTIIGVAVGPGLPEPQAWGMDVALPAVLVALISPQLRQFRSLSAALAGVVITLLLVPYSPAGIPVLAAALGAFAGTIAGRFHGPMTQRSESQ